MGATRSFKITIDVATQQALEDIPNIPPYAKEISLQYVADGDVDGNVNLGIQQSLDDDGYFVFASGNLEVSPSTNDEDLVELEPFSGQFAIMTFSKGFATAGTIQVTVVFK